MVYCGRPSTGCGNCKSRRIKCDEARPHCQNCIKTKRECPGYRAEVDLIFRKEEPGRRKRAKKLPSNTTVASPSTRKRPHDEFEWDADELEERNTPKRQRRGTDVGIEGYKSLQWVYIDARRANSVPDLAQQTRLSLSIEKPAKPLFMSNFMLPHRMRAMTTGLLQVAAPLVGSAKDDSALSLATEAVAMAVMAKTPDNERLNQYAAHLYGRALAATQQAMQDPAQATSDETLLAILLFALYESIVSSEHSTAAWTKHIDGAVAIVRARGVEQFETPQSLGLFRAVRTQMLTNALHQRNPIQEFPGPKGWLSDIEDDSSAAFSMLDATVAIPDLLSRACSLLSQSEGQNVRSRVQALLEDAIDAQNSCPTREDYVPGCWAQTPFKPGARITGTDKNEGADTWPGSTHVCQDLNIASNRIHIRVNQMLCSSVVIDALKWLDPEDYIKDRRYEVAKSRIQFLVDDICCSIPYHLSQENVGGDVTAECQLTTVADAMSAHFLIWPLYTAMNMQYIPELQRRWLKERLLTFAKCHGLGMLRHMKGEFSSHDQGKPPTAYSVQCTQGLYNSNHDDDVLDNEPSFWLNNHSNGLDDVKIDPALLMHDCTGDQSLASEGFGLEQEDATLFPLHKDPIQVV